MSLELRDVYKTYHDRDRAIPVLRGVSLSVANGEVVRLRGASGSGKSTLLNIAGLLTPPDSGEVRLAGNIATGLDDRAASALRASHLGFVFQSHNLLSQFTALENVMLPALRSRTDARRHALELVARVGLADRAQLPAGRLSGGEQQRIALARALVNGPAVILADEPTSGLDDAAARAVLAQLRAAADDGHAVLIASHDAAVSEVSDRILTMRDGQAQADDGASDEPSEITLAATGTGR